DLEDDALVRANSVGDSQSELGIAQQEGARSTADVDMDEETRLQIINHAPNTMSLIARFHGKSARLKSAILQLRSEIEFHRDQDYAFRTELEVPPPNYDQAVAEGAFDEWSDAEISGAADFAPPQRLDCERAEHLHPVFGSEPPPDYTSHMEEHNNT
ncbi:hypothetical protein H0H93_014603, partial [Arthromyces matolae]